MKTQTEKILEIKDLCVEFRTAEGTVKAVNHLSYTLHRGEKLGIVGESGSGKSVSSLGVMRLIPNPPGQITGGSILYKGRDLVQASEKEMQKIRGNEISMIFQEPMTSLNPIIKCGKQIAESLRLHRGLDKKEATEEAVRIMHAVGIANPQVRAYEYPHQMSGGMRQRIMIAMALACDPQILIADEPTTALDVTIQAQILDLIREMNETKDTSVLFITHDLGVVSELCDTVIVMYAGQLVEQASVEELFMDPKHPYSAGLLHAIPKITREREPLLTIEGSVPNPTERIEGCAFWPRCPHASERCRKEEAPLRQIAEDRLSNAGSMEKKRHILQTEYLPEAGTAAGKKRMPEILRRRLSDGCGDTEGARTGRACKKIFQRKKQSRRRSKGGR